jgi:hypothetical protein
MTSITEGLELTEIVYSSGSLETGGTDDRARDCCTIPSSTVHNPAEVSSVGVTFRRQGRPVLGVPFHVVGEPAVYTPDNEPYLGRESVFHFDQVITALMEQQVTVAAWTRASELSRLQVALSELVPGACSLLLSVRELVRQGYLYAAMVLLRPVVERVGTASYLIEHPDGLPSWEEGWKHGTRPTFGRLLETMRGPANAAGAPPPEDMAKVAMRYHELVHGGPSAASATLITLADGAPAFTTGKDVHSPDKADAVCFEAAMLTVVLMARCAQVFPGVTS